MDRHGGIEANDDPAGPEAGTETAYDLLARMRERNVRITPQRRAVAAAFELAGPVHLTAEQVLDRARAVVPEVSRGTVYNTLNELVRAGELRAVQLDDGPLRFDPNVEGDHHHAVCRVCGVVDDIGAPSWADAAAASGFVVERVEVIVRGLCRTCASSH